MPQIHIEGKEQEYFTTIAGIPIVYENTAPKDKIVLHPELKRNIDRLLNMASVKTFVEV